MTNARQIALKILLRADARRKNLQDVMNRALTESNLPQRDRNLATELVYGVLRLRLTLDSIIGAFSDRRVERLDRQVLEIIRMGLYQTLFLERIPPRAAVNESVDLCRRVRKASASGFVNAVLRAILKAMQFASHRGSAAERRCIQINPGRWAVFSRDILPAPSSTLAFISRAHSHPEWMVRRWLDRFGAEQTVSICRANNLPAPIYVRVNVLRTTREELMLRLREEGVHALPGNLPCSARLENPGHIPGLSAFQEGLFQVQDESAMRAALVLKPQPGETVLDLCAAPGGKTTHLAELMRDCGTIIAVDSSAERLKLLQDNQTRLGVKCIHPLQMDVNALHLDERFGKILLDAPCSNTGVMRRRPDARWRLTEHDVSELAELQKRLLTKAVHLLKPDGLLVYSTCSIEKEENEDVVRSVEGIEIQSEEFVLPGESDADGGYLCLLGRLP